MPQNGFHGLAGLAMARLIGRRFPAASGDSLIAGVVLGSMLPDVDMYPTAIAFLAGRKDLVYVIHRTATHSFVFALLALGLGLFLRKESSRWLYRGLAIGVVSHIALDTVMWFTQIDMFWPFSRLPAGHPLLPVVDLWRNITVSPLLINVRESGEFLAFALLLMSLAKIVRSDRLRKWALAAWWLFDALLVSAFLLRDKPAIQNVLVTTPYLVAFLPLAWSEVWKRRSEIAAWARRGGTLTDPDAA